MPHTWRTFSIHVKFHTFWKWYNCAPRDCNLVATRDLPKSHCLRGPHASVHTELHLCPSGFENIWEWEGCHLWLHQISQEAHGACKAFIQTVWCIRGSGTLVKLLGEHELCKLECPVQVTFIWRQTVQQQEDVAWASHPMTNARAFLQQAVLPGQLSYLYAGLEVFRVFPDQESFCKQVDDAWKYQRFNKAQSISASFQCYYDLHGKLPRRNPTGFSNKVNLTAVAQTFRVLHCPPGPPWHQCTSSSAAGRGCLTSSMAGAMLPLGCCSCSMKSTAAWTSRSASLSDCR